MRTSISLLFSLASLVGLAESAHGKKGERATIAQMSVTSSAFESGAAIPSEYTCDRGEKTPPLSWSNVPTGTKSIAILVDDPDAPNGTFTHWMVTNIPPSQTSLSAGGSLPQGAMAAKNGKGTTGYAAPCP